MASVFEAWYGPSSNLSSQAVTEGRMYLTVDDGKLYFDMAGTDGTVKRIAINPDMTAAQIASILGYTPVKEDTNTTYEFGIEDDNTLVLSASN